MPKLNIPPSLLPICKNDLKATLLSAQTISGGDINRALLLKTNKGDFFVKINEEKDGFENLNSEAKGLQLLATTGILKTPKIIHLSAQENHAFLFLEYIPQARATDKFWMDFGRGLAKLHRQSNGYFGLNHSNFIGRLPQTNQAHDNWSSFFIHERLLPQINLATTKNRMPLTTRKAFDQLFLQIPKICPSEPPALIHGDLWNGNFLVGKNETPILIDPSVSYSHREMDLAMSQLFGGFDELFYKSYMEVYPIEKGWEQRLEIYQLYYLLAHVNMFGEGYLNSVNRILEKW